MKRIFNFLGLKPLTFLSRPKVVRIAVLGSSPILPFRHHIRNMDTSSCIRTLKRILLLHQSCPTINSFPTCVWQHDNDGGNGRYCFWLGRSLRSLHAPLSPPVSRRLYNLLATGHSESFFDPDVSFLGSTIADGSIVGTATWRRQGKGAQELTSWWIACEVVPSLPYFNL